jgi:hypothetical protein
MTKFFLGTYYLESLAMTLAGFLASKTNHFLFARNGFIFANTTGAPK